MKFKHLIILICFISPFSWAGSQNYRAPSHAPEEVTKFAKDVEKYAASKGARAFIIARVGRPQAELPKGIHYTHTAIAVYSQIQLQSGEIANGYAIHNLYQMAEQPNKSQLITDYPVDFFWSANTLKAGIIIPTPVVQTRLIELINSGQNATLHNPKYSVIANPFNRQYQNCTEHTLDMLNAAIYQTTDIDQLKANAKGHFTPQRVHTSPLKLAIGSAFLKEVTTKDHKRNVATTTFGSIHRYLDQYQLATAAVEFYSYSRIETL